jgi:hypothetical protein
MSDTPQSLGIRYPLYLGGYTLAQNPATMSEVPFRAETAERVANAFTVVDRPYLFAGAPDVVQKMVWTMSWPNVNSSDYNIFTEIESLPGWFNFCPWKSLYETFSGDGAATQFVLLRQLANVVLSASEPAGVTWTPVTKVNGTIVTNPSFATSDATFGTTVATFGAAPSAVASNIRISYTPCFKVRVVSPKRDFAVPFSESRSLTLEEI